MLSKCFLDLIFKKFEITSDFNLNMVFNIFYSLIVIIFSLLTFVLSFVPLFYGSSYANPDTKIFIYLIILFQGFTHIQLVDLYKKFKAV